MKNISKVLGIIAITAVMVFGLAACQPEAPVKYTVTFNSNGGSAVASQEVDENGKATLPAAPTKASNSFVGWYKEAALTNLYDFNTPVTQNITLYAKWVPGAATYYLVTFNSNGGSAVVPQWIESGQQATQPTPPTREAYTFGGWYKESGLTNVYNFTTPVTANITLYAKWTLTPVAKKVTITGLPAVGYDSVYIAIGPLIMDLLMSSSQANSHWETLTGTSVTLDLYQNIGGPGEAPPYTGTGSFYVLLLLRENPETLKFYLYTNSTSNEVLTTMEDLDLAVKASITSAVTTLDLSRFQECNTGG